MPLRPLLVAAPVLAALAFAAPATADVFCVHAAAGCPAAAVDEGADVQKALDDAAAENGADSVTIGPGVYMGPFNYADPDPLTIVGSGAGATMLAAAAGPADTVLSAGSADVSQLRVHAPAAEDWIGLFATGEAEVADVVVDREAGPAAVTGVAVSENADLVRTTVTMGPIDYAVSLYSGEHRVIGSTISGYFGIFVHPSTLPPSTVRGTSLTGKIPLFVRNARVEVDSSVLRSTDATGVGVQATCTAVAQPTQIMGDHVTILGAGGTGVASRCIFPPGKSIVDLRESIVRGFAAAYLRSAADGGSADLSLSQSDVANVSGSGDHGDGTTTLTSNVDVDPLFAADGFRLAAGSPLIDAGTPGAPEFPLDFDGGPRLVGTAKDIGADEFDPGPPTPAPEVASGDDTVPVPPPPASALPPVTGPSDADLLAELKATLARRRGRSYRHRWLVPGKLTITWRVSGRVVAKAKLTRGVTGRARLRVKLKRRGLRRRARVVVRGVFAAPGHATIRATRRR